MRHDIFDYRPDMTPAQIGWRVALLAIIIITLTLDLFYWRPM